MSIRQFTQSSLKEGLPKFTTAVGGYVPFIGAFESIATVTVGSGGAASMDFTNIPGTYQHLQIRMIVRNSGSGNRVNVRLNSDSGSNYNGHYLYGDGASTLAGVSGSGGTTNELALMPISTNTANVFGGAILDLLDYGSTTKNKTWRSFAGQDLNGSGGVVIYSGLYRLTSAITTITLLPSASGFVQHTTAALYGIKAQ